MTRKINLFGKIPSYVCRYCDMIFISKKDFHNHQRHGCFEKRKSKGIKEILTPERLQDASKVVLVGLKE